MQEETTTVSTASATIDLNTHKRKTKILRYNKTCANHITLDGAALDDVKTFIYLGSIIDEHGGPDADVKVRIVKVRAAYLQLKNIWS
ncbi:unnamed protein product [Schistosoma curassoni]|uniref:Uncharacterized protein n=1 Tax=Schistosoma curassoni TaxID=6186 RepID=A0A183JPB3_9TREM|nr:unnamed protein product [Schistosoma curassoni]